MSHVNLDDGGNVSRRWSIGTLLLWAVNLPLITVIAVLLPMDYRREMQDAIARKHTNLEEEAMTIHQGMAAFLELGRRESFQQYIDRACVEIHDSRSTGHYIAVRWKGRILQAQAHTRAAPDIVHAMQKAASLPNFRAAVGNETLVVGSFGDDDVEVYISEFITNIRHSIQREIILHVGALALLMLAAAAIVNVVLWQIVACPVRRLSRTVSRIAIGDYEVKADSFHGREMNELSGAIRQMSAALAANDQQRRTQMNRARRIQEHLLPSDVKVPGLSMAQLFQPADEVAGDYYDLIRLPDDTWLICVADVAGHGVAGAMGSAMLKALVLHVAETHFKPATILQFVQQRLSILLSDEFITMFLARWDPERCQLDYASAGHEPGILLSPDGKSRALSATGLPLGIEETAEWESEVIDLSYGQRLFLTTDGIAEASDSDGKLFGRERLARLVANCANVSPNEAVGKIRDAVIDHQQGLQSIDDITILVLESNSRTVCTGRVGHTSPLKQPCESGR